MQKLISAAIAALTIGKVAVPSAGPLLPRIGLRLTGASSGYGMPLDDGKILGLLDEAYNRGDTVWDTADKYGASEEIIRNWFAANPRKRKDMFLATNFEIRPSSESPHGYKMDPTPEYCPMVRLKQEGKINFIGLSECSAESLRRAHAVHPIPCVQVEGDIRSRRDVNRPGDSRWVLPWLHEKSINKNMTVLDRISDIAKRKDVTSTAQLALAWIFAQGDDILTIPGTTKVERLEENLGSVSIHVSADEERSLGN
ncbi:Aldo/keto reductase [Aspergillus saccharolyticus JOP 1030-1]|uniref:Aldo/keto reductase n=1 Tax=Aspergillus saccharolyticus JOP 1030-1 TaxID=1450539 RepID=A0A318Z6W2_9EURO|nr:Aldo/keto reductase [Aspergillus saccharolyticus JOP 1030-1]PYH43045.1 Aldo/keto reductase [Aspergillus saccharolyticus JOP 1030-1]